jgi:4-aminobutyrate aminotransferase-like enzyme
LKEDIRGLNAGSAPSGASKEADTAQLLEKERRYCSYGDTVHYAREPKLFQRCRGSYLYDDHNAKYLDLQMWYSTANLGYANPRINAAMIDQLERLPQLACQYLHREKIELSQMICESVERGFGLKGRVHFNVGGAQAIEDAIKLVRRNTGRQRMLAFQGSYHGRTIAASSITAAYRYREGFGEFADRAQFLPFPYVFRAGCGGDPQRTEDACIAEVEKLFAHECTGAWNPKTGHSEFGAFFVEPLQGTGGYIVPTKGYFKRLAAICKAHGLLFVDDEVQMGCYRTGRMWALEHYDAQPDVIVFGKALTNGLNPLSGIWAREELINPEVFGPGSTHSTYSSNTLGTAAGLAVMRAFRDGDYERQVSESGRYFLAGLQALQSKYPRIGQVDGLGLALRMEMVGADGFTPDRELADRMFQIGMRGGLDLPGGTSGIVLNIVGYSKNVVSIVPSLEITREEIDIGLAGLDRVLAAATSQR